MKKRTAALLRQYEVEGLRRWLIVISVMLVAIVEVLDMTIVNVALPHMMGTLEANQSQITWVLTAYVVSAAVCMLLTGFLVERFGRKRLLLTNIVGFCLASMLCGMATSLPMMVICRTLQGMFGAALVPISQFVLRDTFPLSKQGMAMAIWGIGIMVAPVMGPTLGGYIVETLNWRWIFYINVPVCILAFLMAWAVIIETPRKRVPIDWIGLFLMATGVGALQLFLDQGNEKNWFDSKLITVLAGTMVVALTLFILRGIYRGKDNILDFSILKDLNFTLSTVTLAVFGMGIFGTIAIQPIFLERIMNYPALLTGLVMAPRGIASALAMMLVGPQLAKRDPRIFVFIGIILCGLGTWLLTHLNADTHMATALIIPNMLQGAGMGAFFVPLSAMAMATLKPNQIAEASGLFSFGRNLGISVGISILSTVISRTAQANWQTLTTHVVPTDYRYRLWLGHTHLAAHAPKTLAIATQQIAIQANTISFNNAFLLASISFFVMLPVVFCLRKVELKDAMPGH